MADILTGVTSVADNGLNLTIVENGNTHDEPKEGASVGINDVGDVWLTFAVGNSYRLEYDQLTAPVTGSNVQLQATIDAMLQVSGGDFLIPIGCSIEYIMTGNTAAGQNGNYRTINVAGKLQTQKLIAGTWTRQEEI